MKTLPQSNTAIPKRYNAKTLERKVQNKTAFQEELGFAPERKRMLICIPITSKISMDENMYEQVIAGIQETSADIVMVATKGTTQKKLWKQLAKESPHRIAVIDTSSAVVKKLYAAVDAVLLFEAPTVEELRTFLQYGVVPIAPQNNLLEDYSPTQERGNAFLYKAKSHWQCFAAIVRALETYKFPFDWRTIARQCMREVSQWHTPTSSS